MSVNQTTQTNGVDDTSMKLTATELQVILEALKTAYEEISAMEETYEDYVSTGRLMEQLEKAIDLLEGML